MDDAFPLIGSDGSGLSTVSIDDWNCVPSPNRNVLRDWIPLIPILPPFGVIVKLAFGLFCESSITLPGRRLTFAVFRALTLALASILVLTPKEFVIVI